MKPSRVGAKKPASPTWLATATCWPPTESTMCRYSAGKNWLGIGRPRLKFSRPSVPFESPMPATHVTSKFVFAGLEIDLAAGVAPGARPAHCAGGTLAVKFDQTVTSEVAVMLQPPLPEQPPPQPAKAEPASGCAESDNLVPA